MNLNLNNWYKNDGENFTKYLKSFSKGDNAIKFEEKLIKSNYPCIAVPSKIIDETAKNILKGNYLEFLDLNLRNNVSEILLNGKIISKIKDFDTQKLYLIKYLKNVDSWATTDVLKFKTTPNNEELYFDLAQHLIKSNNPFIRRTAIIILFSFKRNNEYADKIFKFISLLKQEKEYYVNMAVAWFLQEWFLYQKELVINLLKSNNLNEFVIRKTISKCCDSLRISIEDKQNLKTILKNNG